MSKVQYQQKTISPEDTQPQKKQYPNKRYQNNNNYRKPRYQDKQQGYQNKHGFQYDQRKISYNTEIPEMPEKPKQKPDQTRLNKKVEELQNKAKQLKKLRKQKKSNYKNGSKTFTDQIEAEKHNIDLAKACLIVLNYDKNNLQKDIEDVENKINIHKKKVDFINRPAQKSAKTNKIQEMNFQELVKEEERITHQMSIKNLTKAEEVDMSNKLNKIKKRKIQVPKEKVSVHQHDQKFDEIQSHKNAIEKLRSIRQNLADRLTDTDNKIESIEESAQDFEEKIEEIHEKLRNTDNSKLLEEAAELKQQIYAIWDEVEQLKEQHKTKVNEFEREQEQIKYIQWAKQIKEKKAQTWQVEKQERKKQKLREKERTKKFQEKPAKQGEKKQTQKTQQERPAFERKKINRNQKQIDLCAFLIQYCKELGSGNDKTEGESGLQKQVKIEQALKKGEWAKMKNVEVIQSKKKRGTEEPEQKAFKKKEGKVASQQPTDRFSHTYFVAQVFDSVKVLPPTKTEELEKIINQLEDKMEYYIAHPDEEVGKALLPAKESERDTKGKGPRKIINTEQFPSLR